MFILHKQHDYFYVVKTTDRIYNNKKELINESYKN